MATREVKAQAPLLGRLGAMVAGSRVGGDSPVEVRSPYDARLVALVDRASRVDVETAIEAAAGAFAETRRLPSYRRAEILARIADGLEGRREELSRTIALEAGKPIRVAAVEVDRAAFTFRIASEEAKRIYGEIVPLDWLPGTEGRSAHVRRVPLGPIAGITPFNFPLNLVAHKVAPAFAVGNPLVLRPASQTPVSALRLAEIVLEAGWPAAGFSVVPSTTGDAAPLVEDGRIKLLTFTGSPAVGWGLKARAGRKRVTLELGGNAPVIVHADADTGYAAERVAWGGFVYSGQTCISVQRVYVHESLWDDFLTDLLARVGALVVGDPLDERTDIGPLIDPSASERVAEWLAEAQAGGAKVLAGGGHDGALWEPTVLADVRESMRISCEEAFAPVVCLYRYSDIGAALDAAGESAYGLQAGLFTNDLRVIDEAFDRIETGGLMVNDVSTFRVDHMPYGGVKSSGFGREGLRYAIDEMTELKLLTFNRPAPS